MTITNVYSLFRSLISFSIAAVAIGSSAEAVLHPEHLEAPSDVVVDRLRERVRALEDHADVAPHGDRVDVLPRDVLAVVADRPGQSEARDEIVHAVEAADERALAASGRADDGGDEVLVDVHRHLFDRRLPAVQSIEAVDIEDPLEPLAWRQGLAFGLDAHCGLDRSRHF